MKFKNYIETESGIKDTSTSPGTAGQVLSSTVTGTSWIDQGEIVAAAATVVVIECKNTHTTALTKGTPVYQTGTVGATDVIEIAPGDALISTGAQPSIGLLQQDLAINAFGFVIITGELLNITTDPIDGLTPVTGQKIFVKSGGGLTLTKPTTELNSIQNMGLVGKVSGGSAGSITVSSIMRTNDVPNLPTGKIWVGDGNTIVSDTVYLDETNNRMGIGTTSPSETFTLQTRATGLGSEGIFIKNPFAGTSPIVNSSSPFLSLATSTTSAYNSTIYMGSSATATDQESKIEWSNANDGLSIYVKGQGSYREHVRFGDLANSTARTFFNGNVGIGTTGPRTKLHVSGLTGDDDPALGSSTAPLFVSNTANSYGLNIGVNNVGTSWLQAQSNTSATAYAMSLNPLGGDVGIGTTTPSGKLEVKQAQNNGDTGAFTNTHVKLTSTTATDNTGFVGITAATSTSDNYGYSFGAQRTSGGVGDFKINYHNNSAAGTNRFIIDQDGNVGIGTDNPGKLLELSGGANVAAIRLRDTTSNTWDIQNSTNGTLDFIRGATNTYMRIDQNGRVGIGTTSTGFKLNIGQISDGATDVGIFSNNQSRLYLTTSTNATASCGLHFGDNQFATVNTRGKIEYNANVSPSSNYFQFRVNFSDAMRLGLNSSGAVRAGIGTTSPSSMLQVNGGVQLANDTDTASASKVGTFRYYTSGNNSYVDMCMQTGAATYAWVNIVQNTW